ncbi:glycosyltransferase family 2 protein [Nocardia cyriacigeorgica]|uniref:Glycosyltransferase n=1 Tax=Nocardia cyriacigeorgica TaxID=135487 RepID=A0A5R8NMI2_9NOCA|nr:glycosyltransferase [Nocardia cyriacigeorgica]TLF76823.1 glycosyltransferase [Nocardia cyriacigeorgica]
MNTLSVCVPSYNAGRTLATTMRSILSQDADFELIVVDNASTDATADIAASFDDKRIRIFHNDETLPIGDNWNRAVALTTGRLVKIVCADDVLRPDALACQLEVMRDERVAICSARFDVIDEQDGVQESGLGLPGLDGVRTPREVMRTIVRRGPAEFGPTAAAMFYREHFDRVGGFRGDLVFPMDVDLFARVCTFGAFFGMTDIVAAWRNSSFNLCSNSSTVSKLTEMLRFHHRLRGEFPGRVARADVVAGDARLVRAGFERVRVRASMARRRPELP